FVEQHCCRFAQQVGRHHRQQRCKSILVIRQTICKGRFGGASARPHKEVNVRDLIAVTYKRFTNAKSTNFRHRQLLPRNIAPSPASPRRPAERLSLLSASETRTG